MAFGPAQGRGGANADGGILGGRPVCFDAPDDGDSLVWDEASGCWKPSPTATGMLWAGHFEQPAIPTTTQCPTGYACTWWDTVKSRLYFAKNRSGVIYLVRLDD